MVALKDRFAEVHLEDPRGRIAGVHLEGLQEEP